MSAIAAPTLFPGLSRFPRRWAKRVFIVSSDVVALAASVILTSLVCRFLFFGVVRIDWRLLAVIPPILATLWITELYSEVTASATQELRRVLAATTVTFASLSVFEYSASAASRVTVLVSWAVSICLLVLLRSVTRGLLARRSWWGTPAVILGGGATGWGLARILARHPSIGLKVVAVLDDGVADYCADARLQPEMLRGHLSSAPHYARELNVPYAVIAASELRSHHNGNLLSQWATEFEHVLIIPDIMGLPNLWASAAGVGGLHGIEVRQNLSRPLARFMKRLSDIIIAGTALLLMAPFLLILYVAIRLFSPGPAFYGQGRLGCKNKPFTAWKFRTMAVDADGILLQALGKNPQLRAEWERDHKLRKDPRVTPIGRILRKTSLDELPQLWNILIGDMSVVGPRPIVTQEIAKYGDTFNDYCMVRPGLTGLWQVSGRNNTTYEERVRFDEYYVRNWSLWLDLFIIFRTIKTVAFGEGAY
jgi:Undecaprenyl-phosphate galactose phosphotransferase WbaP